MNQEQWWDGFLKSCQFGFMDSLKVLLERQDLVLLADPHQANDEGLMRAVKHGQMEVVRYFLTSDFLNKTYGKFDFRAQNDVYLRFACDAGQLDMVKYFLSSQEFKKYYPGGLSLHDGEDERPLQYACEKSHWHVVKWLILDWGMHETIKVKELSREFKNLKDFLIIREEWRELSKTIDHPDSVEELVKPKSGCRL